MILFEISLPPVTNVMTTAEKNGCLKSIVSFKGTLMIRIGSQLQNIKLKVAPVFSSSSIKTVVKNSFIISVGHIHRRNASAIKESVVFEILKYNPRHIHRSVNFI